MADAERERLEKRLETVLTGKWKLEKLLGYGGMAAVYQARHTIGTQVAVKVVHPEVARSKELRLRFEQEARVMAQIKHPGAVDVRDVDHTEEGLPFIVMELLTGEPLSDKMRRLGTVPLDEVLRHMDELLDVLDAAHKQGIIHRDIKLDNLFIIEDGSVKVLDFGIARVRDAIPLTMVGARLGTLPYMPPEQVTGKAVDGRVDIFAVGAVMFRLIAKRRIHEAKSEQELLIKMTSQPAPRLETVVPSAPVGVRLVVDRALAFDRNRRYPDAATMQRDVQALRNGEEPPYATRALAREGAPNPLSEPPPRMPSSKTLATRVASPLALRPLAELQEAGPQSAPTAMAPAGAVPAGPLSDTGVATGPADPLSDTGLAPAAPVSPLAPSPAAHPHAKLELTKVASAGAAAVAPPVAVAVQTAAAEGPRSATAAATPFDAVESVRRLGAKTAVLASSEAQLARHTMVSSQALGGVASSPPSPPVAVMEAAPSSVAPMSSPAPMSGPSSGPMSGPTHGQPPSLQAAAMPFAAQSKHDDTRVPVAVWISIAGAVLLLAAIGLFFAWPSSADEVGDDATATGDESASDIGDDLAKAAGEGVETSAEPVADGTSSDGADRSAADAKRGEPAAGSSEANRGANVDTLDRETGAAAPTPRPVVPPPAPAPRDAKPNAEQADEDERERDNEEGKREREREKEKKEKRDKPGKGHR